MTRLSLKSFILFLFYLFSPISSFSQIGVNLPISIYASDLDNNGDMDVLSASSKDNKISLYKNTNNHGKFGSQQVINTYTAKCSQYAGQAEKEEEREKKGYILMGLTLNNAPDIFRVDFRKERDGFGSIHYYGSDYKTGWGGTWTMRGLAELGKNYGFGIRLGLVNFTKFAEFDFNQVFPDSTVYRGDSKIKSISVCHIGGSLWGRLGPFIFEPYVNFSPLSGFSMKNDLGSGSSYYLGFDTGLELQIVVSEKVHLLFGIGYAGISKKEHKFEMKSYANGTEIVWEGKSNPIHVGFLTDRTYNFYSIGLLISIPEDSF